MLESYGLYYILSAQREHRHILEVKLVLVRQLRAAQLGEPKKFSLSDAQQRSYLKAADHELLYQLEMTNKLADNRSHFEGYSISGEMAEKILQELIATRRCLWQSTQNPPLSLGSSKTVEKNWNQDENALQDYYYDEVHGSLSVFYLNHVWYLDPNKWQMGFLETGKPLPRYFENARRIIEQPEPDDWYLEIDERTGYDWFGVELGIILKGEKINLLPILQKTLYKLQANERLHLHEAETVLVQLPQDRCVALPIERLRNILKVFIELYEGEGLNKDSQLKLSNLHAARLLELEKALGAVQLRWFGGERIQVLAEKLTNFKGIETVALPAEFKGELRPYQLEGLSWLQFLREYNLGGILADDMGLGKTIQALAHLSLEKSSGRLIKPCLIVAPTSLMFNWRSEAEHFAPHLKILTLHGDKRKIYFDRLSHYDVILTTYPLLVRDKEILIQQNFYMLILDEAQFIKNHRSFAAQVALQIKTEHRYCLTGTPMENHLGELWSLFHFMMPGLLGDESKFKRLFRTPIEKQGDFERRTHLNRLVAPFLLRRTKDEVLKELPAKIETLSYVELDGAQRDLYETIRITMQQKVQQEISKLGLARSRIYILDALLKLRQVCCDPRLLALEAAEQHVIHSAKLDLLMIMIPELLEDGRRILLFSQFTSMLTLIAEELQKKNIPFLTLTGKTKDRATPIQQFQNGEVPLFLISLKAGGTGLNLTAADAVIHYDPWWNPAVEHQATDRAHRIGQDKTVFVYKLVAKGTVEEKILQMQEHKQALMDGLFSDNTVSPLQITEESLQELFNPLEESD